MLVLLRRPEQSIVINGNIIITVLSVDGERVRLGIQAPPQVAVLREELLRAVGEQNRAALVSHAAHATLEQRVRNFHASRQETSPSDEIGDHNTQTVPPPAL
jgi:carbon storage regulator